MSNEDSGCCGGQGRHHHDHEHGPGCDCGHDHEEVKMTISLDGEEDVECHVLGVFEVGEREYIALLPEHDDEIMLFRYSEDEHGVSLEDIATDEEYEEVAEVFYEVFLDDADEEFDAFDDELDDDNEDLTEDGDSDSEDLLDDDRS